MNKFKVGDIVRLRTKEELTEKHVMNSVWWRETKRKQDTWIIKEIRENGSYGLENNVYGWKFDWLIHTKPKDALPEDLFTI